MNDTLQVRSITGVDIELPLAGPGGRSYAFIIDWHIRVLFALAWLIPAALLVDFAVNVEGDPDPAGAWMYFWLVALPPSLIYFLYHPVLELAMKGQTPGKRMAGVRIVTLDGATPGVAAILIRNVFRLVDSLPGVYAVGMVATLVTANHVRLGDLAAGTVLVYHAGRKRRDMDTVEQLGRSGNADPRKTAVVQELLERWGQLAPDVRRRLATKTLASLDRPVEQWLSDAQLRDALRAAIETPAAPAPDAA